MLAELCYLVQERKGIAVVTGEVGTGKTLLLRTLMESLAPSNKTAYLFNPPHTRDALYLAIADELDIDLGDYRNPAGALNRRFLEICEKGNTVTLIFDEAQSLQPPILEEVRQLTNLETSNSKLVQVILAGHPEFDAVIDSMELRALRQRLMFRVRLTPFDAEETRQYIASRLVTAGTRSSLFTADASNAVHDFSSGIPRLINVICDNAMLAGYVADRPVIEKEFIEEVAADLKLVSAATARNYVLAVEKDTGRRSSMSRGQLVFTVAIACLVLVASLTVVAAMGG